MLQDILIREANKDDREQILTVVRDAFAPEPVAQIVDALWNDSAMTAEFVAEVDSVVAGYCGFSPITLRPALSGTLLQLSPVAVTPEQQRKGIGSVLLDRAIDAVRRGGVALVAVLGHPEYYPRFGFSPAEKQGVFWGDRDVGDALQIIDFQDALDGARREITMHPVFEAAG
jgi:putative acetyltransferase